MPLATFIVSPPPLDPLIQQDYLAAFFYGNESTKKVRKFLTASNCPFGENKVRSQK